MARQLCCRSPRWLILLAGLIFLFPPPAWTWDEATFFQKQLITYSFVLPEYLQDPQAAMVIGSPQTYTIKKKDTLLDIARYFDLGYNELVTVYLNVDPWVPDPGETLQLPTIWVLPQSRFQGIVVNIPEMRLYYFPPATTKSTSRTVITLPVGVGRENWPTPQARFTIRGKTVNPTWVIPASIRQERIQKKGWSERSIPGGSAKNPLGKHRIELTLPSYAIHGTNNPWAVGRLATHGCIRLYPEDIAQLFHIIHVGTPGEFIYQPVKVGSHHGRVYVEVHEDLYGLVPDLQAEAYQVTAQSGWGEAIDHSRLQQAVRDKSGVPVDVTKDVWPEQREEMVRVGGE